MILGSAILVMLNSDSTTTLETDVEILTLLWQVTAIGCEAWSIAIRVKMHI